MLTHKKPEPKPAQNDVVRSEGDDMSMNTVARGPSSIRSRRKSLPNDEEGGGLPPAAWEIGEDESDLDDTSTKAGSRLSTPKARTSSSVTGSPAANRRSSLVAPSSPTQQKTSPSLATTLRKNLSNLSLHTMLPGSGSTPRQKHAGEEGKGLMHDHDDDEDDEDHEEAYASSVRRSPELERSRPPLVRSRSSTMNEDDFGDWEDGTGLTKPNSVTR
ncbi:hypothetical protein FRC03_012602 [Tulasnella sp. 419]|nr:hypothetical protein FRC03_012602 [Tulasnella sp. 419]